MRATTTTEDKRQLARLRGPEQLSCAVRHDRRRAPLQRRIDEERA